MTVADTAERVARASYGKLLAILTLQSRDIAAAGDALSEALVSALSAWPRSGVPDNPEAWLVTAARNRLRNAARAAAVRQSAAPDLVPDLPEDTFPDRRLALMFLCAHPAIDPAARIARAFLVEPAAMSQRLVRAKARIRDLGLRFDLPSPQDQPDRLAAVLEAIYAAFGQAWEAMEPVRPDGLTGEAIWLARLLCNLMPEEPEPKMLYCTARAGARRRDGTFVPLAEQDHRLWDRTMIIEAEGLLTRAAKAARFGHFQCEAAIQSVHVQRAVTEVLNLKAPGMLYDLLVQPTGSIGALVGRAVVMADAGQPESVLAALDAIGKDRIAAYQPWWMARAHAARLTRHHDEAARALEEAIRLTEDPALRAYLEGQRSAGT